MTAVTTLLTLGILAGGPSKPADSAPATREITALPVAIASFGAAVQGEWLYVAGGHVGKKHEHSTANLSSTFARLKIDDGEAWEVLPGEIPLQSVSLVSDGRRLYRVGGLSARNAPDEPEDLHSVDVVAMYDPQKRQWRELPPLPKPRSSHDSVIIDSRLYVAGGWCLTGSAEDGEWPPSAYVLDLENAKGWRSLPSAPFARRAVALAGIDNRLFVMGGIDESGATSRGVDILDLKSGQWTRGPRLPSSGFGMSAFAVNGSIYASGMSGDIYRLRPDESNWQAIGKLRHERIFHRLLPAADQLLFVGGANRNGHLTSIETATIDQGID